ncbi:hypothetical protein BHM03_00058690 [Ensete ventricosum]|nr:hypothetical protein BHM03_00058690 [Ensete ventricosum]
MNISSIKHQRSKPKRYWWAAQAASCSTLKTHPYLIFPLSEQSTHTKRVAQKRKTATKEPKRKIAKGTRGRPGSVRTHRNGETVLPPAVAVGRRDSPVDTGNLAKKGRAVKAQAAPQDPPEPAEIASDDGHGVGGSGGARDGSSRALVGRPVCARPPASQSLRHRVELVRMSGDSGLGVGGLMLEWGSPGEEGVVPWGSAAGSCKEVGSGRFPT